MLEGYGNNPLPECRIFLLYYDIGVVVFEIYFGLLDLFS